MLTPARFIGPDTRSRRRAFPAAALHGLLRPPARRALAGPPRCRSARSADAVSHFAGVERPDKLQAPNYATDNGHWHDFQPVSGEPGQPAQPEKLAAPVSFIRFVRLRHYRRFSNKKRQDLAGLLRRGARLPAAPPRCDRPRPGRQASRRASWPASRATTRLGRAPPFPCCGPPAHTSPLANDPWWSAPARLVLAGECR